MIFAGVNLIKYLEGAIAFYALSVGLLFLFGGSFWASSVYAPWHEFGELGWGIALVLTAMGHATALWINGRDRVLSRTIRAVANTSHFYISIKFATLFLEGGSIWGFLTFAILIPSVILPVMASTVQGARSAVYDR